MGEKAAGGAKAEQRAAESSGAGQGAASSLAGAQVRLLGIYPVKEEPGRFLEQVRVETEGLVGDRRKKRPVHVVGHPFDAESTRANLFLDIDDDLVRGTVGARLAVGECVLDIVGLPTNCPGVYADVVTEGLVRVGDRGDVLPVR